MCRSQYRGRKGRSARRKLLSLGWYCQRTIERLGRTKDLRSTKLVLCQAFPLSLPRGGVAAMNQEDGSWTILVPRVFT
jgi:hypothetical protein